jgi:CBS domain-containing protein
VTALKGLDKAVGISSSSGRGGKERKMGKMKRAGELMIPLERYPHVPYWFSLRQAVAVMENTNLYPEMPGVPALARFALVFNESYKLLGITRRRDILRGLKPPSLAGLPLSGKDSDPIESTAGGGTYAKWVEGLSDQAERPVSEVMLPIQTTVNYDDHILKVVQEMVENNLSMVPVLKENMVVGVIRSVEVFHEIAKLIL